MLCGHWLREFIGEAIATTDTYSLPQGQDEFYFALPYHLMDIALHSQVAGKSPGEMAAILGVETLQAERIYADLDSKRSTTRYLHQVPVRMN